MVQKISLNKRKKQDRGVTSELKKIIDLKKKIFIRDEILKPKSYTFHSQMDSQKSDISNIVWKS